MLWTIAETSGKSIRMIVDLGVTRSSRVGGTNSFLGFSAMAGDHLALVCFTG